VTWVRWDFSASFVCEERLAYLREEVEFDWLVNAIRSDSRVTNVEIDHPRNAALKGSKRPVFQVDVQPKTFDLFYNSPWGYRGQYCQGVEIGLRRNRQLLASLADVLLGVAQSNPQGRDLAIDLIRKSLELPTAKVWIYEPGQIDPKDYSLRKELLHPEWLRHAREARAALDANRNPTPEETLNAIIGVRAPCGRILDVKGAWITTSGAEVVDDYKKYRAEHIRDYGFS